MRIIRKTLQSDLEAVMNIVNCAKAYMKKSGIDQWQNGYPDESDYLDDIKNGISYVVEQEGEVIAVAAINTRHEADYDNVAKGSWLSDAPYGAIHRIAVKESLKGGGIGGLVVQKAIEICRQNGLSSLRCDTHADNLSMQRMLTKNGFTHCCTVMVHEGTVSREAFEMVL